MFMLHMTVTQTSLSVLTCHDIEPEVSLTNPAGEGNGAASVPPGCPPEHPSRRLYHDLDACCYDPSVLATMYGLGIPGVLAYAMGIPLFAAILLYRARDHLDEPRVVATLGFLQEGYTRESYYWEVVIMLRKMLVTTVVVFLEPWGARIQTYAAQVILFAMTSIHVWRQPFERVELNALELGSLVSAFLTFVCGLFLFDEMSGQVIREMATVMIFVVNLGVAIWAVALVILDQCSGWVDKASFPTSLLCSQCHSKPVAKGENKAVQVHSGMESARVL